MRTLAILVVLIGALDIALVFLPEDKIDRIDGILFAVGMLCVLVGARVLTDRREQ